MNDGDGGDDDGNARFTHKAPLEGFMDSEWANTHAFYLLHTCE